jgi:putative nucleotidyltransferase with HDIG domain
VDDEEGIRRTLAIFLGRKGYDVKVAGNVTEAAALLESAQFDVVLSDIVMPGRDGIDLLGIVRERQPHAHVILITGQPTFETAAEAMRLGAFDYLAKPVRQEVVCRVVDRARADKALRDENRRLNAELKRYNEELEQLVEERTRELTRALADRDDALMQLRCALENSVATLALTVEVRDPYTAGHQSRVAELAGAIARKMKLPEATAQVVVMAAQVHDIGKIAIPAGILAKPGKLSRPEFELIQTHPEVGHRLLKRIGFPWPIHDIVFQHHERLDGSGYPDKRKGKAIRVEARILAVADVVEAMCTHRPYRPALGLTAALEEIDSHRSTHFDPIVVDACLAVCRSERFAFSPATDRI